MRKKKIGILLLWICALYSILLVVSKSRSQDQLTVIGFHHIAPDEIAEKRFPHNMWVTKLSTFEEEMKYLYEHGYHTLSLQEVYDWKHGNKQIDEKSVVLTFDDGFLSSIHYAEPILQKYGFQGSVFAIASEIREHGPYDDQVRQHASLEDIKQSSLAFYSHTYDLHHKAGGFAVDQKSKEEIEADIKKNNQLVSSEFLAYPYGRYNDKIISVLKENKTKLAFGFNENRKAKLSDSDYRLPRFCVNRYTSLAAFQAMLEE